jgi:hypothetical protein
VSFNDDQAMFGRDPGAFAGQESIRPRAGAWQVDVAKPLPRLNRVKGDSMTIQPCLTVVPLLSTIKNR